MFRTATKTNLKTQEIISAPWKKNLRHATDRVERADGPGACRSRPPIGLLHVIPDIIIPHYVVARSGGDRILAPLAPPRPRQRRGLRTRRAPFSSPGGFQLACPRENMPFVCPRVRNCVKWSIGCVINTRLVVSEGFFEIIHGD